MSEITPNTPNPVREDAYVEELAAKLGIDPQYIPKSPVWRNEEEIKAIAEMFANMSGGGSSGGGVLVVHNEDGALDKTWKEIHDAFPNVYIDSASDEGSIESVAYMAVKNEGALYNLVTAYSQSEFIAESENGYPAQM